MSIDGCYKIPESNVLNGGYGSTLGERWNFTLSEAPYYKNIFQTRIYYSDIAINDAFKNGYRVFRDQNYRDYPIIYGGLVKLITVKSNIIAIFEESVGGAIFINTNNVLPENPSSVISDMYGTQWPESIVQTPKAIYGVDTVAKKIWQLSLYDLTLNCISDFKVQQFLNQNIKLNEFTTTPIIGVRNVKTHYNPFKQDVMFTFYNSTTGYDEVAWNLCFNESQSNFVTFYSWLPSFSESIDNMFFTFDRNTSKWISKLAISKTGSSDANYITIGSVKIDKWPNYESKLTFSGPLETGDKVEFTLEPDSEKNNDL